MDNMRTIMDFKFETREVQNTHFHQNLEIVYVLEGGVEIQIEPETYNLKKGDFLTIKDWMKEHVFKKASLLPPKDWIRDIAGEDLNPKYFIEYLEEKYKEIYDL